MRSRLKFLFILSVVCSAGLLFLQGYWISQGWARAEDILKRQVDFSLEKAVSEEWGKRKDTLSAYLSEFLHDTSFIGIGTRYNSKEKLWMITMYDPDNPSDYSSWSNVRTPVGEVLSPAEKETIIEKYIEDNVRKSVATDVIFYYTQRFGKVWEKKFRDLAMDTAVLRDFLAAAFQENKIGSSFSVFYRDTLLRPGDPQDRSDKLYSKEIPVNYKTLNDYDKQYRVRVELDSAGLLLLERLWKEILPAALLLGLTLFCLYRMYFTIRRQKRLDELKDDFISNMTHELKTPIATVSAAIDGLQYYGGMQDEKRAERYLNTSRIELNKLDNMLSKVLKLSMEDKWNASSKTERILLKPFLEQVLMPFDLQAGFSYTLDIDPAVKLHADPDQMAGAFQNLIENAIKYGKKPVEIRIWSVSGTDSLKIVLQDNGPGIDEKYLPYIFNKFYRASSPGDVKGFGLGLYYVARTVSAHGGNIRAENTEEGLRFIMELPVKH